MYVITHNPYPLPSHKNIPLCPIWSTHSKPERHQAISVLCNICCCFGRCLFGSTYNPSHQQQRNHGNQGPSDQPVRQRLHNATLLPADSNVIKETVHEATRDGQLTDFAY